MRNGLFIAAALLAAMPAYAAPDGANCKPSCLKPLPPASNGERPLRVEVHSDMKFTRMALRGRLDGSARIDPITGETLPDANMINLGGVSFQGKARIFGEPLRPVLIEMPSSVELRSPRGSVAVLNDFQTDLPPVVILDQNGELEFAFGARVTTTQAEGGNFRGKIRIRVDYF